MSWDLSVQDYPKDAASYKDVPADFTPKPFGTRREIIRKIREVVPDADFSGRSCGRIDREDFSVEIWMTPDDEPGVDPDIAAENRQPGWMDADVDEDHILLSVRGNNEAAFVIADILRHLEVRAYDCWKDDFFDPDHPLPGLHEWQGYVEKIHQRLMDEAAEGNDHQA